MKKKATVLCLAGALMLGTCTVSAANGTKNISATFRNIKIVVDGKTLQTSAEPFIYNGTTYLPIRAVGEAVGKEVTWDGGSNTVYLGGAPASAQQQADQAPALTDSKRYAVLGDFFEDSKEIARIVSSTVDAGGDADAAVSALYLRAMEGYLAQGDSARVKAAYEEAQAEFAEVSNLPTYSEVKAHFEETYQNEILPKL